MEPENQKAANTEAINKQLADLAAAREELMAQQSQAKFMATGRIARTLAHEVRNPLTNINLAMEQLVSDLPEDDNTRFLFDMIDRNSKRINQIISELLNSTRFAELNIVHASVNEIIKELLQEVQEKAAAQHLKIVTDLDSKALKLPVDVEKIKTALRNLVVNAMELLEGKKDALLSITTRQHRGGLNITIEDNGPGLNEEDAVRVFEPYFTRKQGGQGLSLTTTQNIILNHKGEINFNTAPGKGMRFNIRLIQ
ncbi:MAG: hypothetical protein EOO03_12990 [Chitinophagaceae bacterium]|nr:MAG: hypothetical protein EOO03_12990 [Chitinophagaceae bacterium]